MARSFLQVELEARQHEGVPEKATYPPPLPLSIYLCDSLCIAHINTNVRLANTGGIKSPGGTLVCGKYSQFPSTHMTEGLPYPAFILSRQLLRTNNTPPILQHGTKISICSNNGRLPRSPHFMSLTMECTVVVVDASMIRTWYV